MKLNNFKESKGFVLDDEQFYYGMLTEIEQFTNPKKNSQGGLKFKFEIINSKPLLKGEEGDSSRGKELKVSFWANGKDADGNWTFPKNGMYKSCLEGLCKFLGKEIDEIEGEEDIYGGVIRFGIDNEDVEGEFKGKKTMNTYSNIKSDSIKSIAKEKLEEIRKGLVSYHAWKKKQSSEEDIDNEEETMNTKKSVKKESSKKKKEEDDEGDDDGFADEQKETKNVKKEVSKKKKEEPEDDGDGDDGDDGDFFN